MESPSMRLCFALLLLVCATQAAQSTGPGLAFERIYMASRDDPILGRTHSYLMFHRDGTVIGVASTGAPREIASWFHRNNAQLGRGSFKLARDQLSFSLKAETGVLKYVGVVEGERLVLKVVGLVDRQQREYVYSLVSAEQAAAGDARNRTPDRRR